MRSALKMSIVFRINHNSARMSAVQRKGWQYVRPGRGKRRELKYIPVKEE